MHVQLCLYLAKTGREERAGAGAMETENNVGQAQTERKKHAKKKGHLFNIYKLASFWGKTTFCKTQFELTILLYH